MISLRHEVAGWYKMEAVKPDGSRRLLADWFPNLITDGGLDRIATNGHTASYDWCQVGSGSTTPAVTDSSLASHVAGTSTKNGADVTGSQPSAPYFGWRRKTWRFAQGAAAGNLSEVGVGWATSGSLFSRALILDSGGTPTTITVLADEFLDVTYELRQYPVTTDNTGTLVLDGLSYDWVSRASSVTSSFVPNVSMNSVSSGIVFTNGAIGAITGSPSGTPSGAITPTAQSYSAGSHSITFTLLASISQGNVAGGITAALLSSGGFAYQFGFTPAIPKDNTKILSIDFTHTWARKTL